MADIHCVLEASSDLLESKLNEKHMRRAVRAVVAQPYLYPIIFSGLLEATGVKTIESIENFTDRVFAKFETGDPFPVRKQLLQLAFFLAEDDLVSNTSE